MRSPFARSVAVIAGGSVIAQVIPIAFTPIVTRLYTPSDLGLLALYSSFVSFASSSMSLGYSQAIVSAQDDEEAADLLALSTALIPVSAMLAALVLWIFISQSLLGFGELPLVSVIAMMGSLTLSGTYFACRYWLVRNEHFAEVSKATIAQSVGRIGTQISVGVVRAHPMGLIFGEVAGRAVGLGRMWRSTQQLLPLQMMPWNRQRAAHVARKYRKFPLLSVPASLLDSAGPAVHVPAITALFGASAAGQFSVANMIIMIPVIFVGTSIADVFHSRISTYRGERAGQAFPFFLTVGIILLLLGLIPAILLLTFAERLFELVLGAQWGIAGAIAAVMAPRAVSQLVVSPLSRIVFVYQGQGLKLVYNVLSIGTTLLVYWTAALREWSLVDTLARYTWLVVGLHVVYFLLLAAIVHRGSTDG